MVIINEVGDSNDREFRQRVYISAIRTKVKPCNKNH